MPFVLASRYPGGALAVSAMPVLDQHKGSYTPKAAITLASALEPDVPLRDVFFEMTSAFATVGLSTGITPELSIGAKIVSCIVMYVGRLGPLTVASVWYFSRGERVSYPEGNISIG